MCNFLIKKKIPKWWTKPAFIQTEVNLFHENDENDDENN